MEAEVDRPRGGRLLKGKTRPPRGRRRQLLRLVVPSSTRPTTAETPTSIEMATTKAKVGVRMPLLFLLAFSVGDVLVLAGGCFFWGVPPAVLCQADE